MSVPASSCDLARVRAAVKDLANGEGFPAWPLTLIVTELLANAIEVSPDDEVIDLTVACEAGAVEVHVADAGPGLPIERLAEHLERAPAPSATGGRGLYLVGHFSDEVRVDRNDGRTILAARLAP